MADKPRSSNRVEGAQPTRGADRNRDLASRADPATDEILFPSLDEGITLLDVDDGRGVTVLQSLVLDHLLMHEGPAFWADAAGHATTTTLARIAPSRRLLDRIHVARGFTAYQHHAAVCDLPAAVNQDIKRSGTGTTGQRRYRGDSKKEKSPQTPSLIVAPAVDAQYRADDTLAERHAETLQARTLAQLRNYAQGYEVPVLVTRSERNEFTAAIQRVADHHLECKQTRMGPRFVGEDFETLVYPVDGDFYQTTFAYWQRVLDARAEQLGVEPAPNSPSTSPSADVGTAVTTSGKRASLTTNPLHDAWTAGDTGGR
jgi:hypothetical protein